MKPSVNLVCLAYKHFDYLIEKDWVDASFFIGTKSFQGPVRELVIDNVNRTVVNLDYLFFNLFDDAVCQEESMILKIGDEYFETSSQACVKNVSLSEFNLFGKIMDTFCHGHGIIAVRYVGKRIQYLVDIKKILNCYKEIAK